MGNLSDYGETKYFWSGVSTGKFTSIDKIASIGWHRVNDMYKIERDEGARTDLLLFTLSGIGEVQIENKKYIAEQGTVIVIPAHVPHMYKTSTGSKWEFYWCHYTGENSCKCTADIIRDGNHLFLFGVERITRIFKEYIGVTERSDREIWNSEWLRSILVRCLRRTLPKQYSDLVLEVVNHIENNTLKKFSLDAVAKKLHYSKEYIIREFSKQMGVTPYHYWRLLQLERSCIELMHGKASISEIASMYGLGTVSNYCKQFNKHMKTSPLRYRKMFGIVQN